MDPVITKEKPGGLPEHEREGRPHPGRAIVTYGRSLMSLVIARSLDEQGVEVIGCDDVAMTVLSFSRHVEQTFTHASLDDDPEQALKDIEAAVRKYAPEDDRPYVLIPAFRDAKLFAEHRDRFEPLIKVAAPDFSSIEKVHPKDVFADFVEEADVPAPATKVLPAGDRDIEALGELTFPLIAKPNDGVGGRGVEKIDDEAELQDYLSRARAKDAILLQEVVEGKDYCVSFVAVQGQLVGVVAYHNLTQFPREAGAGASRETVDAAPFRAATEKLVRATKWNGVAEIDFRWDGDPDSEPKVIEINPRYWAGLFHSTASGVDFPWIAYRIAAGLPVRHAADQDVKVGFRSRTPGAWIMSAAQEVAASDEHMQESASAWEEARERISKGEVLGALAKLMKTASFPAHGGETLARFRAELEKYDDLPSELNSDDDPDVGLGVLFALSSLVRHGKLPPEFKFEVKEDAKPAEASSRRAGPVSAEFAPRNPVIGITKPSNGDTLSWMAMAFAVRLSGGKPVKITSRAPRDPHSIDGLLFGGGADVFPERYQGEVKQGYSYDQARDDMETSWAKAALEHEIPVLGVCRGMQMLNVFAGGTLHHDLSAFEGAASPETFFKRIFYRKPIRITPGSRLDRASTRDRECVNSIHTQAIARLGKGFKITAREPNSLVQAIEHEQAPFMMGVQFHPEYLIYRKFARNIFKDLVETARWRAAMRAHEAAR